mmetsp:Transcript_15747/g.38988  ORF Transcript_15747/g.38988 Transcript_15747/m.38988 type:complete len:525 (+) Transcript_15747:157-1731(+)|eukprot:CAMPEP_0178988270 /NCGR_PEP_ID=MMETSP0795-20121207/3721_1 /TAXON_ID=88552 /ORGANISM="Amoebophrya sp., Strain Ameob2" /LENGTH=524 /DNA_ID=CAMNT_0020679533 /DNA_START=159 /DNA_END=1733 /DNA_ORIENTATION=-
MTLKQVQILRRIAAPVLVIGGIAAVQEQSFRSGGAPNKLADAIEVTGSGGLEEDSGRAASSSSTRRPNKSSSSTSRPAPAVARSKPKGLSQLEQRDKKKQVSSGHLNVEQNAAARSSSTSGSSAAAATSSQTETTQAQNKEKLMRKQYKNEEIRLMSTETASRDIHAPQTITQKCEHPDGGGSPSAVCIQSCYAYMGECYGYTQPGDLFDPGSLEMSTNLSDKCKMVTKECHASEVLYLAECDLESLQLAAGTPKTTAATYPAVFGACDAYLSSTTTTTPTPVDEVLKSTEVPPGGFLEFGAGGKSGRGVLDTIGRAVTSAERAVEDAATRAAAGWSDSVEEDVSLLSDHSSSAPSSYNHAQLKFAAMQLGLGTIQHTPMLHFTCTDNKLIDQGVDFEHLLTAGAHNNSESVHNKGLLDNAVREVCLKPIEDNESTKYLVEGTEAQRGTSVQYDVNWFKDRTDLVSDTHGCSVYCAACETGMCKKIGCAPGGCGPIESPKSHFCKDDDGRCEVCYSAQCATTGR